MSDSALPPAAPDASDPLLNIIKSPTAVVSQAIAIASGSGEQENMVGANASSDSMQPPSHLAALKYASIVNSAAITLPSPSFNPANVGLIFFFVEVLKGLRVSTNRNLPRKARNKRQLMKYLGQHTVKHMVRSISVRKASILRLE